jgi:hypothetical protein
LSSLLRLLLKFGIKSLHNFTKPHLLKAEASQAVFAIIGLLQPLLRRAEGERQDVYYFRVSYEAPGRMNTI